MNHLPFEEWLLNDMPLTPERQRELESHVRNCAYCAALAETGNMLRMARMASPVTDFAARFQTRLAVRKAEDRKRKLWGALIFAMGGLILLMWFASPALASFFASPASWVTVLVGWIVFLGTTLFALLDAGLVILSVIPNFLTPFAWMIVLSMFAGMGLLWSVSIWRFARQGAPQGV